MDSWSEYVAAFQALARARTSVRQASQRVEWLSAALTGRAWERAAALEFLAAFSDDVPILLDRVFAASVSHKTGPAAWEVLRRADERGLVDRERLAKLIWAELNAEGATEFEYGCVISLLRALNATDLLTAVRERALASSDPAVRRMGG
ncbi:hypothetical protein [Actinokineospora sp. UTMC 2448]|uniref:hypothetical protein n=1 Tax=Actinokineospora sp. UTMC 2448 TaxID=2268449 RepID=UPI002164EEE2|nr:hypothetical protein [Actinokineospora sp. UTMC 2448]